jgi:hypothetical protein
LAEKRVLQIVKNRGVDLLVFCLLPEKFEPLQLASCAPKSFVVEAAPVLSTLKRVVVEFDVEDAIAKSVRVAPEARYGVLIESCANGVVVPRPRLPEPSTFKSEVSKLETLNMGSDEELLELMKASGCAGVLIGFESLKRETLMAMNKPINTRFEYEKSIKQLHRYGIALYGTFIFGYDTETVEDIRHTVEKAIDFGIFMAAFNHLLPFPGTPTYERLEAEKRLVYKMMRMLYMFRW